MDRRALSSARARMRSVSSYHKKFHHGRKAYNPKGSAPCIVHYGSPVGEQLIHARGKFQVRLVDGFQHILDASSLSELLEDCGRCDSCTQHFEHAMFGKCEAYSPTCRSSACARIRGSKEKSKVLKAVSCDEDGAKQNGSTCRYSQCLAKNEGCQAAVSRRFIGVLVRRQISCGIQVQQVRLMAMQEESVAPRWTLCTQATVFLFANQRHTDACQVDSYLKCSSCEWMDFHERHRCDGLVVVKGAHHYIMCAGVPAPV